MKKFVSILTMVIVTSSAYAFDITNDETDVNGTFNSSGRRSQDYYFNVQDAGNGSYACWSAAKWTGLSVDPLNPGEYYDLSSANVVLNQSNAGFTTNGTVAVYVMPDTFDPGSNHFYGDWNGTWASQSTQIGTYNFVEVSSGYDDVIDINNTAVADSLEDGTLVLGFAESGVVSATWAGNTNFTYAGPTLNASGTVVPEPTSLLLLGLGALLRRR